MCLNKYVNKPFKRISAKWQLLKKRHNVYSDLLRPNWMFRFSENAELSMEEIHHHDLQFIDGTRNLWRQGQCWIQLEVGDQEHLGKLCFLLRTGHFARVY